MLRLRSHCAYVESRVPDQKNLNLLYNANGIKIRAYPGPPAGGGEHALAGEGKAYHVHVFDENGREVRLATKTWEPLTDKDARIYRDARHMKAVIGSFTQEARVFLHRINRNIFFGDKISFRKLMRLSAFRLGLGFIPAPRGGE